MRCGLDRDIGQIYTHDVAAANVAAHRFANTLEFQERYADGKEIDEWLLSSLVDDDTEENDV